MTIRVTTGEPAAKDVAELLSALGVPSSLWKNGSRPARSPITGEIVAHVLEASPAEVADTVARSVEAFHAWRTVPAPRRGELVRLLGEELRAHKAELGLLVTLEAGKVTSEGLGEVQEMIDICDFAVGLSRQLYGLTIASERPGHRMMESWHPIGPVGIITAFNFPVAVWSWNAALALVCGDSVIWKPSEKTPLTALAVQALFEKAAAKFGDAPAGLSQVLIGAGDVGAALVDDARVPVLRRPARPAWAASSASGWRSASAAPSSSSAATMPPSSARRRISASPCAASPSPPWARRDSAAPRCAG